MYSEVFLVSFSIATKIVCLYVASDTCTSQEHIAIPIALHMALTVLLCLSGIIYLKGQQMSVHVSYLAY